MAKESYVPKKGETVCRGSFVLGTACGNCPRCDWEYEQMRGIEYNGLKHLSGEQQQKIKNTTFTAFLDHDKGC